MDMCLINNANISNFDAFKDLAKTLLEFWYWNFD